MIKINNEIKEKLAELCHKQWSGWMQYLFSKCYNEIVEPSLEYPEGTPVIVIPKWVVERWTRQMNTDYINLTEIEKDSDRLEADKIIQLLKELEV